MNSPATSRCDSASQSEVVVPLVAPDGTLIGVWDVDSPVLARFDEERRRTVEALCAVFIEAARCRARHDHPHGHRDFETTHTAGLQAESRLAHSAGLGAAPPH